MGGWALRVELVYIAPEARAGTSFVDTGTGPDGLDGWRYGGDVVRRMLQGGRSKLQEIRGLRVMQRHRSARAALGNMVA